MSKFFMGLGIVLLLAGIGTFFVYPAPIGVFTNLPDTVFGANDTIAIDPDRVTAAVQTANDRANTLNESGIGYQTWAQRLLFPNGTTTASSGQPLRPSSLVTLRIQTPSASGSISSFGSAQSSTRLREAMAPTVPTASRRLRRCLSMTFRCT